MRKMLQAGLLLSLVALAAVARGESFPVVIKVDAAKPEGDLKPIWRFFGADEPNYATMKNGKKLIGELGELAPKQVYFRAHNLLTSGDGTPAPKWGSTGAYSEDANGKPVYNWKILDGIFDTYLKNGVKPYAQIGFMPKEMSVHPDPYQHSWSPGSNYGNIYTGWSYPPKDYEKWGELAYQWVAHCVKKYGRKEVESWYWEVWNEPNIGYWLGGTNENPKLHGTTNDFLKLHDYAIAGVRRALPTAKVGGADTAGDGGNFTRVFLEHCLRGTNYATGQVGTPIDFMSFHAKGAPAFTNGHVRMGIQNQLRTIDTAFRRYASYPELKGKPIVIGESDPDGCAACEASKYPANRYRNRAQFATYTVASIARMHDIAANRGVNLEGSLTWSFQFEDAKPFDGYRTLASGGLDKPVMNAFRMMSQMSGKKLLVESDHAVSLTNIMRRGVRMEPDVAALASLDKKTLCVLVWHYHDDDLPGPDAEVDVALDNIPMAKGTAKLQHFRIDEDHSNAVTAWMKMGAPKELTSAQYKQLEKAGQLEAMGATQKVSVNDGKALVKLTLPRQGISLLKLTW
jgi:xylan 1,4-beta-xylosidase